MLLTLLGSAEFMAPEVLEAFIEAEMREAAARSVECQRRLFDNIKQEDMEGLVSLMTMWTTRTILVGTGKGMGNIL